MYYNLLKQLLFRLNPEAAHYYTLHGLRFLHTIGLSKSFPKIPSSPRTIMNINFPNPIGLAAGLDKNGDYIDALTALGFGFIEVGTVTPHPQVGNPLPRVFRYPQQEALVNRLGFNNKGVDYLVGKLRQTKYQGVLGVNIGKNRSTAIENAVHDYLHCFRRVAAYASYVTLNISSPNTEGLRELQHGLALTELLRALKHEQALYHELHHKYVPLVVKLSPDLSDDELQQMAEIFLQEKLDGVIATNTTLNREGLDALENGGLSGKPLSRKSTAVIKKLHIFLQNKIPIIASGGVMSAADVTEKIAAGASLVQVYSGLIYAGPGLIEEISRKSFTKIGGVS